MYIYTRLHKSYYAYNICKFGKTKCIVDTHNDYKTHEYTSGYYASVIEILEQPVFNYEYVEDLVKAVFEKYFRGDDFYDDRIIDEIPKYLTKMKILFKILTEDEILNIFKIKETNAKIADVNPQ